MAFRLLDADNDGFISRKEFSSFIDAIARTLTRIGIQNENISSLVDLFFSSESGDTEASNLPQISTQRTRNDNASTTQPTHSRSSPDSNLTTTNSADSLATTTTMANTTTLNNSPTNKINSTMYNSVNNTYHNIAVPNNNTTFSTQSSLPISHKKTPPPSNVSASRKTSPLKGESPSKTPPTFYSLPLKNTSVMSSLPNIKGQPKEQSSKILQNISQVKGDSHQKQTTHQNKSATNTTNERIFSHSQHQTQSQFLQRVRPQCQPRGPLLSKKDVIDFERFKMIAICFKDIVESLGRLDTKNINSQKEDHVNSSNSPSSLPLTQSSNKLNFMNDVNNIVYDNKHYNMYKSQHINRGLFVAFGSEQWELTQYILLGLWKLVLTRSHNHRISLTYNVPSSVNLRNGFCMTVCRCGE